MQLPPLLSTSGTLGARSLAELLSARHRLPLALLLILTAAIGFMGAPNVLAGGGPENVFLIVNANNDDSKTIANHYIEWRKIPAQNVFYLDWKGDPAITGGVGFRDHILMPALKALEERKLNAQIDYLVYSSGFPWRINLQNLFPEEKFPAPFSPFASLTGATYLAPFVVAVNPSLVRPDVNWYVPGPIDRNIGACQDLTNVLSRGFRARYLWDKDGQRTTDAASGQRYLLSTMLGVTSGRGNTVSEVLAYLRRAVQADGKRPRGTIYFMQNNDVRSQVRHTCYDSIADQIRRLGAGAVVQRGTIPQNAKDVAGLMAGVAGFDWGASGSTITAGAICDHLTSLGGVMAADGAQTPLTDFLRHGAAGASGTVVEPRAIQAKFPLPSLHLHYVRGCSLAEAFYQSVSGPYQLLVVGDPLCQPWATFPSVKLNGVAPDEQVQGPLKLSGSGAGGGGIGACELYLNGRLIVRGPPGQDWTLDTTKLPNGYHELRLVGSAAGAIETQGRQIVPIMVKNGDAELDFKVTSGQTVGYGGSVQVSVRQPEATAIVIRQNSREVGRVQGEAGQVEVLAATLGRGPTTLQAVSEGDAPTASAPIRIVVR